MIDPLPVPTHGARASGRAVEVRIRGVVQGVGFRPFVHRLALRRGVRGWVRNEAGAVHIVAEGDDLALTRFLEALRAEAPPLSRIDDLEVTQAPWSGVTGFQVMASDVAPSGRLPVSPDVAMCPACEVELRDPANRRYRYPFITCTDCGPRFTVIESMPYDRERSTMSAFPQCPECAREYSDPESRRYHSETNSCPVCGPRVWLEMGGAVTQRADLAIRGAGDLLRQGRIVAVRGLGGFHVACDAGDELSVRRLRARKHREAKPLAIMVRTLEEAQLLAHVSSREAALLTSRERPLVVLERRSDSGLAEALAPGLSTVGVMLAYTPLHSLLLEEVGRPLVMTSGNASEEPIAIGNDEARQRLGDVADAFLLHDREIVARYDDSLVRAWSDDRVFLRRGRGYAPLPVPLPVPAPRPFLAVGPHLKNTLTLAQEGDAWVSQHVGDLENLETLAHFQDVLNRFRTLFRLEPEAVVRDLHPGYLSTRIAEQCGLAELPPVQHHHAHIAAVQGEHGEVNDVLGLAFDGTGYGEDGKVWGGEFLHSRLTGFRRVGCLRYAPLPGGDAAARAPWRSALGYVALAPDAGPAFEAAFRRVPSRERALAEHQLERGVNAPEASSMGRLFDAAAAVLGVRDVARFEGQAPMELESLAGRIPAEPLPFPASMEDGIWVLDPVPLLEALGSLRLRGVAVPELAARFHESVASAAAGLAIRLCGDLGLDTVALGGGCFQNMRLLDGVALRLRDAGLRTLVPHTLGPNDGAISYGQAVVAAARLHTLGFPSPRGA
ncbi:MAG: carbamoyltransferase HypF [Gemmatimonadetes bacterium]|nr:carbamoyltransferase HypF [Gemmatimonadota bacterium]